MEKKIQEVKMEVWEQRLMFYSKLAYVCLLLEHQGKVLVKKKFSGISKRILRNVVEKVQIAFLIKITLTA